MTPAYAAPEFFKKQTSSQSDQYSLAVTYCHLRGGRLPFTGGMAEVMAGHLRGRWGQTEFQVYLELGLTPRSLTV